MTGVLVVPSLKRVYGSVTKNHEVAVVDTESLKIVKRIPDGKFPDGLAFSADSGLLVSLQEQAPPTIAEHFKPVDENEEQ